jgi:hypothetical protein
MRKAPIIFLLVISFMWHTFAVAGVGLVHDHGDGLAHVVLHLEKEPHHHHDDGTFHADGTDESLQHVYADGCANTTGVVPANIESVRADVCTRLHLSLVAAGHDSPILEGPRRPPRLTA